MLSTPEPPPLIPFGQGKRATTLLTDAGYFYPVIAHGSYTDRINERVRSAPNRTRRGDRPMHRTTMMIGKPPWVAKEAYVTTSRQNFSGSKSFSPVRRPPRCPSMHTSQVRLAHPADDNSDRSANWNSHYEGTFIEKPIIPANRLHLTSLVNRTDQTEGIEMKRVVKLETGPQAYWSQYGRIHNKLGALLGTGVPREYPVRQEYNVLTGEERGTAWRENNKRVSGNRVLHDSRKERTPLLG